MTDDLAVGTRVIFPRVRDDGRTYDFTGVIKEVRGTQYVIEFVTVVKAVSSGVSHAASQRKRINVAKALVTADV